MILYVGSRRSYKTTAAIKMAASTHSLLIVPNIRVVNQVKKDAERILYPVRVMAVSDYFKEKGRDGNFRHSYQKEKVVIDELDWCMREIFGVDVIMATTTGMKVRENRKHPTLKKVMRIINRWRRKLWMQKKRLLQK